MRMTRRAVVGSSAAGALMLLGSRAVGETLQDQNALPQTDAGLLWPTVTRTARPWTRWWWHGNAVDKPNLTRLLETYRQAGLGGVEITSIYGVKGQDAREISYLSSAWGELLKHTCAEAHRLDMGVDLPPGSGWRIGGPNVPAELASANVVIETRSAKAGEPFRLAFTAPPQAVVAYGPDHAVVPLTASIDATGHLTWAAPAGVWTVYTVSQKFSGSKVKRPGPGGAGNSIDPFSQRSLAAGLEPFEAMLSQLPPKAVRAQFHDSYEYEGNWTEALFPEFLDRCGYDLREHLPALVGQGEAEEGRQVRNDYRHVMGELFLDKVITPWVAQAHRHGGLARNQAHGSPGNLLDLYAAADIPETEVFGADRAPLMAMFASSAAHVMGKPLISSETGTWLAEHFTETLAELKAETDMLFCAGINHIFFHGTAYSPADALWPGWLFYASTELNPNNPIWRDTPTLNAYITRCQSLLQSGRPDNDILLYWPERDVWQGDAKPLIRQLTVHKREWFEKEPFGQLAQTLVQAGYTLDYVSDRQLALARTENTGEVRMPGGLYRTVLVPACRFMPLETLQRLKDLAETGATILFQNDFPSDVPGWGEQDRRRERFRTLLSLFQPRPAPVVDPTGGNLRGFLVGLGTVWLGNDIPKLIERVPMRRERLVDASGLTFVRRIEAAGAFYFLVNHGKESIDRWVPFASLTRHTLLMDPMNGRVGMAATRTRAKAETEVYVQLAPGESLLLRTVDPDDSSAPAWKYWQAMGPGHELTGTWQVEFLEGGPETPPAFQTAKLASWTTLGGDRAERFAGTARYTLRFTLPEPAARVRIDLGRVCQSARVRLNGKLLGVLLSAPFQAIAENLKPIDNVLEIEVTGVAANRIRDLDQRGVEWKIFKDINFVGIDYRPFNAADWPLTDCGLLGPVRIEPLLPKKP
jgi:hypothetical protein